MGICLVGGRHRSKREHERKSIHAQKKIEERSKRAPRGLICRSCLSGTSTRIVIVRFRPRLARRLTPTTAINCIDQPQGTSADKTLRRQRHGCAPSAQSRAPAVRSFLWTSDIARSGRHLAISAGPSRVSAGQLSMLMGASGVRTPGTPSRRRPARQCNLRETVDPAALPVSDAGRRRGDGETRRPRGDTAGKSTQRPHLCLTRAG